MGTEISSADVGENNRVLRSFGLLGDGEQTYPKVYEHSMFISKFVYLGSDGSRVTKTIDGVLHFGITVYMSFNFDCTKNWKFKVLYKSDPSISVTYQEAVVEYVSFVDNFMINGEYPVDRTRLDGDVLGLYTMKVDAWVPYTQETEESLFIKGKASEDREGEPFYSDKLISRKVGNIHVNDNVLVGYEGVVSTNLVFDASSTKTFSDEVVTKTSATHLVRTLSDGVYELRS